MCSRYDGLKDQPIPIPSKGVITLPWHYHGRVDQAWQERPWAERRSRLVDALAGYEPDVIGFQVRAAGMREARVAE